MKTQKQIMRETDPVMILAKRYRLLCDISATREDLQELVERFPDRYRGLAFLLNIPDWTDMSELNH